MWFYLISSFLAIFVVIYIFNKQNMFDLKSKQLYSGASAFCFTAFIMAIKFSVDPKFGWGPKHTWERLPYGTYPIWMLGFISLAFGLMFLGKSLEDKKE